MGDSLYPFSSALPSPAICSFGPAVVAFMKAVSCAFPLSASSNRERKSHHWNLVPLHKEMCATSKVLAWISLPCYSTSHLCTTNDWPNSDSAQTWPLTLENGFNIKSRGLICSACWFFPPGKQVFLYLSIYRSACSPGSHYASVSLLGSCAPGQCRGDQWEHHEEHCWVGQEGWTGEFSVHVASVVGQVPPLHRKRILNSTCLDQSHPRSCQG